MKRTPLADRGRRPARRAGVALLAIVVLLAVVGAALPAGSAAEQASQPGFPAAGQLDVSGGTTSPDASGHTCALAGGGALRCWGAGLAGRLGYGNTDTIGDNETPGKVGPVDVGGALTAIGAGGSHSCGLLDGGSVRCWGFGAEGRLGYSSTTSIGDNERPSFAGPVDLGAPATAISGGGGHTCAVLVGGSVRCWGFGRDGRLGYPSPVPGTEPENIGDDEKPSTAGPVDLGGTAKAISAHALHSCALLDGGSVRCWGVGSFGALGYGNSDDIGDDEKPSTAGPVEFGGTAKAISAGNGHTCAVLDGGSVRCWGFGGQGRLGYGNTQTIGDTEKPSTAGPVNLGGTAKAISAGDNHTCALLDGGDVRCWGFGGNGRLGYANTADIGDNEAPGSVGPVNLGSDRKAVAISAGGRHTCALLDDGNIRCWGEADTGRLGYCNRNDIGDNETPGSVGPVNVTGSSACPIPPPGPRGGGAGTPTSPSSPGDTQAEQLGRALAAQARRKRALRSCYAKVKRHARREQRNVRRGDSSRRRARAKRHIKRHLAQGRRACRRRHGRTPGRVRRLRASALSRSKIVLSFSASGTAGGKLPAARTYVIKQSRRPIRGSRGFRRAQTLCRGRCRFDVTLVGDKVRLTVRDLRPRTTYYYSVAARDNVSGRRGRSSPTAKARTRR